MYRQIRNMQNKEMRKVKVTTDTAPRIGRPIQVIFPELVEMPRIVLSNAG